MRRLVVEEPVSRAATWGRRIALFSVPVFSAGVVLTRNGGDDINAGLAVILAASVLAAIAMMLGIGALAQIWREGRRGVDKAIQALALSAMVLLLPAFLAIRLVITPYYADLTTDLDNPPAFSRSSAALSARDGFVPAAAASPASQNAFTVFGWPPEGHPAAPIAERVLSFASTTVSDFFVPASDPAKLHEMQRRALPAFRSLHTYLAPDEAFHRATKAAQNEGWTIADQIAPGGLFGIGHLDAVNYSSMLRLPVDMTVRLRIHAEGTTIDVRSRPRYSLFDLGTGPRMIERFLEAVSDP